LQEKHSSPKKACFELAIVRLNARTFDNNVVGSYF